MYELASARFGFSWEKLDGVQAFHFKGGQAAKTGTGGHLPDPKVTDEIASVRNIPVGEAASRLARYFDAVTELMVVLARACGHDSLGGFVVDDLTTFDRDMASLAGIDYGGARSRAGLT